MRCLPAQPAQRHEPAGEDGEPECLWPVRQRLDAFYCLPDRYRDRGGADRPPCLAPVFRGGEEGKVREDGEDATHDERGHQELAFGVTGPGPVPDGERRDDQGEIGDGQDRVSGDDVPHEWC